jgi:hypothetical protein
MSPNPRTGVLCACVILLVTLSLVCSDHVDDLLAGIFSFSLLAFLIKPMLTALSNRYFRVSQLIRRSISD